MGSPMSDWGQNPPPDQPRQILIYVYGAWMIWLQKSAPNPWKLTLEHFFFLWVIDWRCCSVLVFKDWLIDGVCRYWLSDLWFFMYISMFVLYFSGNVTFKCDIYKIKYKCIDRCKHLAIRRKMLFLIMFLFLSITNNVVVDYFNWCLIYFCIC